MPSLPFRRHRRAAMLLAWIDPIAGVTESTMADSSNKADPDLQALRADFDKLRADLSAIAATLTGMADAAGGQAADRLRGTAKSAQHEAERAAETVQRAIADQPLIALAVAFVTGVVLGLLFGRR
jgi:ElaB/YqjD/DUF883 family membrane-anchored ribosome-binding protein